MTALLLLTSPRRTLTAVGGGSAAGPSHSRQAAFFGPTVANGVGPAFIATLEDLDEASLKLILTQPKNALLKQYQQLFEMEGVDLTVAEEALGAIARKAIDRKTGARGLRSIMEAILLDTMFELPSLEGIGQVMISQQVVEATAAPLYMYAARTGGARAT